MNQESIPGAIVLRVSTADQDEEHQLARCERYAELYGIVVGSRIIRGRESGRWDPSPRKKCLEMIRSRAIRAVIVDDLSRWSRQSPLQVLTDVANVGKIGGRIHSVAEPWLGVEGHAEVITFIVAWANKKRAEDIVRSTRSGLERVKAQIAKHGSWRSRTSGKVRRRLGRPQVFPVELARIAAQLRAEKGSSWSEIARSLEADGYGRYKRQTIRTGVMRLTQNGGPDSPIETPENTGRRATG